jgi:hypothetical protein
LVSPFSHSLKQSIERFKQLTVIDYRTMQNSTAAPNLRNRLIPSELKTFDKALRKFGLNEKHNVEQLSFVLLQTKNSGKLNIETDDNFIATTLSSIFNNVVAFAIFPSFHITRFNTHSQSSS